ncbi:zinc-binding dehydrogenase [Roseiterribacter gracilis]|uniref:NADP-dependent oxidoreductase n=1 Tax=Roseiterribacter gracilis TaxID=2812848 RepID=A0A8S8X8G2_9PROT|nr:NADP-dependent oxidoreductase [Rhodospirillales bacterium TMPK1]
METARKWTLPAFGEGFTDAARLVSFDVVAPGPQQLLVRNRYLGVNGLFDHGICRNEVPYRTLVPPLDLGLEAVGEVIAIGRDVHAVAVGDAVVTAQLGGGYRECLTVDAADAIKLPSLDPTYVALVPSAVSALLAVERVAEPKPGEVAVVAAAAGGLGQFVVQFLRRAGCRVIGLVSGDEKARFVRTLGCDAVIDRANEQLPDALARLAPDGINIGFDTVGGAVFDAFVDALAPHGRVVVSGYAADMHKAPEQVTQSRIYHRLYWKAASVRAFQNALFREFAPAARGQIFALYRDGALQVKLDSTLFKGIESVPAAVEHLRSGKSVGKVWVEL